MICNTWTKGIRCQKEADMALICPDGKQCPGGWFCQSHAQEITKEYQEKLGEMWIAKKMDS